MNGIKGDNKSIIHYLWLIVQEYKVLLIPQLNVLLRKVGVTNNKKRLKLVNGLKRQISIFLIEYENKEYICSKHKTKIKITPTHQQKINCFWILLDYIDQVDTHFATGTYSRISMIIEEKDYDIVYVEKGEENLCLSHIENNGETTYIIVVEHPNQISFLYHQRIKIFATVSEIGKVTYYKQN